MYWLLNGKLLAHRQAKFAFDPSLSETGRMDVTVMDDHGRFDRVSFSVR